MEIDYKALLLCMVGLLLLPFSSGLFLLVWIFVQLCFVNCSFYSLTRSPKMLADSMTLGKDGARIREHMDQLYLDERSPGCARVAVPRTILPEDVTEPRTGIKFPTLLEDNSNPTAEVVFPSSILDHCVMYHFSLFQNKCSIKPYKPSLMSYY
jgi:hypothetical protein